MEEELEISEDCYQSLERTMTDARNTGYTLASLRVVPDPNSIHLMKQYGMFKIYFTHYLRENLKYTIDTYGHREKDQ